ncbi:hypothetical protein QZH41_003907 [Actinostola sp. cb2023]|nr:hypothetical protein QZH41_003907 [Actinostola sp. cb2023]
MASSCGQKRKREPGKRCVVMFCDKTNADGTMKHVIASTHDEGTADDLGADSTLSSDPGEQSAPESAMPILVNKATQKSLRIQKPERRNKGAIQAAVDRSFGQLSKVLDDKLKLFATRFAKESSSAIKKVVNKSKQENFTCKRKGNQQQFEHCQQVLEKFDDALESLGSRSFNNLKRSLEEGSQLVAKRIKAIKLADKSEYGWLTVNEYLSDELASDTDDEKRIYRSEKRAEKKAKDKQRLKLKTRRPTNQTTPDRLSALAASSIQQPDLKSSGLVCNEEKFHWNPMQVGEWLGFIINTVAMQFQVPAKKLSKLKGLLDVAILDGYLSIRQLAKIAGSVISLTLAVGPICRLFTRQMYFTIESRSGGWDQVISLYPALVEELRFWLGNLDNFNGYAIRPPPLASTVIFTDASDVAFGGFSASLDDTAVRGMWTSEDATQSSTYRELKAIYYVLLSYAVQLKSRRVVVKTDNQELFGARSGIFQDPSLDALAPELVQLQLSSKADATISKYASSWCKWRTWANSKIDVPVLPAQPVHVALYLTELFQSAMDKGIGASVLEAATYAIRWRHQMAGFQQCPTDHSVVKSCLEGAKRRLGRPVQPKEPLSLDLVVKICDKYVGSSVLSDIRFLGALLIGYGGFLRVDEIQA